MTNETVYIPEAETLEQSAAMAAAYGELETLGAKWRARAVAEREAFQAAAKLGHKWKFKSWMPAEPTEEPIPLSRVRLRGKVSPKSTRRPKMQFMSQPVATLVAMLGI